MLRSICFKKLIAEKGSAHLTVGDVMATHPVTLGPEAKIWDAVEIMESQGFNHIPIVQDGKLLGLLTERHVRDAVPSIEGRKPAGGGRGQVGGHSHRRRSDHGA